jgi:hypothetical protein
VPRILPLDNPESGVRLGTMSKVFFVRGHHCLVEGSEATIYIPAPPKGSKLTNESALGVIAAYMKLDPVKKYLVDEGFIDGSIPVKVKHLYS